MKMQRDTQELAIRADEIYVVAKSCLLVLERLVLLRPFWSIL